MPIHEKIPPFNFLLVESLRKVRMNAPPDATQYYLYLIIYHVIYKNLTYHTLKIMEFNFAGRAGRDPGGKCGGVILCERDTPLP